MVFIKYFEQVFNTHNHHVLHHANNKEYLDKNFGSILIVWDKLFGTFAKQQQKPVIGILGSNYAYDPILLITHTLLQRLIIRRKSPEK